ncbi:MAG TPA: LysR family transcriptional regulator [Paraburkholderia sp.]|uniref:LysR family transcriptional regulator n=1 Tax=Paraburkholderia sp. TaxID=1926495 RepID=UPI002ED00D59
MLSAEELALLEAIRQTGSLSRAAARLGKAPSTVSHAARQLETRFDALLFDRRRYRLQLTPAGQLLADEAARLMLDMSRMTQHVRQIASGWEDRLWIVTDEVIEFELLMPVVRAFDQLDSGVRLRFTHEVLGGTWEALRAGRADVIVGATNEPPAIPGLRWFELGVMDWVFAVSPRHPLASDDGPLERERILAHRAVVVADSSRGGAPGTGRAYGVIGGQAALAVPSMRAKILAQRDGLGVGWLPRERIASLLARGDLIEKVTADPREPNVLYVAWRGEHEGRALQWWLEQLCEARLAQRLVRGIDMAAGA